MVKFYPSKIELWVLFPHPAPFKGDITMMNRLANSKNRYQGDMKKVLCVCSAGLLRSPTVAWILSNNPFNFNTRAVGITKEYALIPVDEVLIMWADEIVVVEDWMRIELERNFDIDVPIHVVETPDKYQTRDPELIAHLTPKLRGLFNA